MGSTNHHQQRPQVAKTEKSSKMTEYGVYARNFRNKSKELFLPLYKSLVYPHLKHAVQFWSTHLRQDIDKIRKIQRRATKMIPESDSCGFCQKPPANPGPWSHQPCTKKMGGPLIELFKYLDRFTASSTRGLFDYDLNDRTRNNGEKLIVKHFKTSVAQHFYQIKITTNLECPTKWSC